MVEGRLCVRVCVCVRERERQRETETERDRGWGRGGTNMNTCMKVGYTVLQVTVTFLPS